MFDDSSPADNYGTKMVNQYDAITWISSLRPNYHSDGLIRHRGYAVNLEGTWFFFLAIEPAYAFARAGRMSLQVGSSSIVEAVTEVRYDSKHRRDIRTLFLLKGGHTPRHDPGSDRKLLQRFADGVQTNSSHWHVNNRGSSGDHAVCPICNPSTSTTSSLSAITTPGRHQ
jgi:hypothetical protein